MPTSSARDGMSRAGSDRAAWLVAGGLSLPLLVAAVAALTRPGLVTGDLALIEIAVRDTGTSRTPLVGAFSRYGWNHPGPLMFWLLAPLYRIFGREAHALYAAAALVNGAALGLLAWLARRIGGRGLLAVTAAGAALLVHAAGPTLADPWNPYFAMVPFAVFLMAAAGSAGGDRGLIPLALAAGSLVVQSHVGYAVPIATVSLCCVGFGATRGRPTIIDRGDLPRWLRGGGLGATCAAVLVVAWSGPLLDQVRHRPGNLAQVVGFFVGVDVTGNKVIDEPIGGIATGVGMLGRQLHLLGPWVGGVEVMNGGATVASASAWWAVPLIASLLATLMWSWRRGNRQLTALSITATAGVVGSLVASVFVRGEPYWYLFRFWWPVAMLAWMTVFWAAATVTFRRAPRRRMLLAGVTAVAVVASVNAVTLARRPEPPAGSAAVAAMADDVTNGLVPGGVYLVEPAGWSLFWEMLGFVNLLDARGFTPVITETFANHVGDHRVLGAAGSPAVADGRLIVAMNRAGEDLATRDDLILLSSHDPLTAQERGQLRADLATAASAIRANGSAELDELADGLGSIPLNLLLAASGWTADELGIPSPVAKRLATLEGRGPLVMVYLAAP